MSYILDKPAGDCQSCGEEATVWFTYNLRGWQVPMCTSCLAERGYDSEGNWAGDDSYPEGPYDRTPEYHARSGKEL